MHSGQFNLRTTFGENAPSVDEFRLAFYDILIDLLNQHSIERKENSPVFKEIEAHVLGMEKIRFLVQDLVSALHNIQRYRLEVSKLILEITIEKRKLNLPCLYELGRNVNEISVTYPLLDLSYLDLSNLLLEFPFDSKLCGCTVNMSHSNLDYSDLKICANYIIVNLTPSSLRGCDLKNFKPIDLNLKDADISGAYFGDNWIPDRRAKNFLSFSRTVEDLVKFRNESRLQSNIAPHDDKQPESNRREGPSYNF